MYVITQNRVVVCYTSEPRYVVKSESGTFHPCEPIDATHVVAASTPYRIKYDETFDEPVHQISTVDVGQVATENQSGLASLDKMTVDQEYRITLLELGVN